MTDTKVRRFSDGAFKINHDLAGLVPMANEVEQAVLTADIKVEGLKEAIILWHGEVIDGRCRMLALMALGMDIYYKEMDDSVTEEEARIYVKSVNTRRNLTHTQKVISAYRSLVLSSMSVAKTAKAWGISRDILSNAKYIAKERPEFIEPLFNGKTVKIVSADGVKVDSNKVSTIYAAIRREKETVVEDEQYAWREDTFIKTQRGKEAYYAFIKDAEGDMRNTKYKMAVAELMNYKYSSGTEA